MAKISKLEIKNFLGVKDVEYEPSKQLNLIKGKNGEGKTSILEAIEKALANEDRRVDVIHDNQEKAEIIIEMDNDLSVRRSITEKGDYLKVEKDGMEAKAPQTFLDNLVGNYSFNPIDFIREDSDKQAKILLNLLDISINREQAKDWIEDSELLEDIDFDQHGLDIINDIYDLAYQERRDVNREVKKLDQKIENESEKIPEGFDPDEYRDTSFKEKFQELQEAQEHNEDLKEKKEAVEQLEGKVDSFSEEIEEVSEKAKTEIERLREKIKNVKKKRDEKIGEIEEKHNSVKEKIKQKRSELEKMDLIDTEPLEKEVEELEDKKELVKMSDRVEELQEEKSEISEKAELLDTAVRALRDKPQELVQETDLPITGLAVEDDQVTIQGQPIDNLSTGEQIQIALKIARATTKNKDLKFICVDGIEVLDPENKEQFIEKIKGDDFQYFVTETSDSELELEPQNI